MGNYISRDIETVKTERSNLGHSVLYSFQKLQAAEARHAEACNADNCALQKRTLQEVDDATHECNTDENNFKRLCDEYISLAKKAKI